MIFQMEIEVNDFTEWDSYGKELLIGFTSLVFSEGKIFKNKTTFREIPYSFSSILRVINNFLENISSSKIKYSNEVSIIEANKFINELRIKKQYMKSCEVEGANDLWNISVMLENFFHTEESSCLRKIVIFEIRNKKELLKKGE